MKLKLAPEKICPQEKAAERAAHEWVGTNDWSDGFKATQWHFERAFEEGAKWQRKSSRGEKMSWQK